MKKLSAVLSALLIFLLAALPVSADVVDSPGEYVESVIGEWLPLALVVLAISLIVVAVTLLIRAIVKKRKGKK